MITLRDELHSQIRMHVDGIPAHTLLALLMSSNHGPWEHSDIIAELARARADGFANVEKDGRWHQTAFSIAKERYELTRLIEPTWQDRATVIIANLWPKISHAAVGMGIVLFTAICLIAACAVQVKAQEVDDRIIAAVAMIETGSTWKNTGDIHGAWTTGAAGEISHWQITDAVLADLGLTNKKRQIASSPVYAESVFRLWYSHLLDKTGSNASALAAYHRGLGGRNRRDARAYAERVLNLASTIN